MAVRRVCRHAEIPCVVGLVRITDAGDPPKRGQLSEGAECIELALEDVEARLVVGEARLSKSVSQ